MTLYTWNNNWSLSLALLNAIILYVAVVMLRSVVFAHLQLGLHHIRTRLYSLPLQWCYTTCTNLPRLYILLMLDPQSIEFRVLFGHFLLLAFQSCQCMWTRDTIFTYSFANKGSDALNLCNSLNKKSVQSNIHHTFKIRSRHAFPKAILSQLLPTFLIRKEVCINLTSIVFPIIPYLAPGVRSIA